MKKVLSILTLAVILCVGVLSCKKSDSSTALTVAALSSNVKVGMWKITLYSDSGSDETIDFTGFEFQFNSDGTTTATMTGTTASGTWSDDMDDSQLKLILNYGTGIPFEKLNDDWHVISQSSSTIKLEDVSGGSGATELLTFEKI